MRSDKEEIVFTFGTPAQTAWTEEQVIDAFIGGLLVILKNLKSSLKGFSGLINNIAGRRKHCSVIIRVSIKEVR